jgi:hypothetical protein
MDMIFTIFFFVAGTAMILFSQSKKDYQNCVEQNGEEFALNRKKKLKLYGTLLLVVAGLSLLLLL